MTINDRIRIVRDRMNLSQTSFAESLGCGRGIIKNIEEGRTEPKPQFIDLICTVYNINRLWLETGEGEMLADMSREEKIGRLIADILDDSPESFRRRVFEILVDLDADGWKKLQDAAELLAEKYGTKKDEG